MSYLQGQMLYTFINLINQANQPRFFSRHLTTEFQSHLDYFKENYYRDATFQSHYSYLSILSRFKTLHGEYPTNREFYLSCKQSCGMLCPYYITDDEYVSAADFFVKNTGEFLGNIQCDLFYYFTQFYVLERRSPSSLEEFMSFYRRNVIAQTNPESLFENDVVVRPVERRKIEEIQNSEFDYKQEMGENVCGICQDDLSEGHKCVKLDCGHLFHTEETKCCETGTIFKWFETHHACPICRKEII